ncbi:MAG: hypothetical protein IMX00_11015 [Limnochordales bacterium]|nr:hypothetical protein [Limnochordales bacterium]
MAVQPDASAERERRIKAIVDFVSDHRESLASLVICRRALGEAVPRVNGQLIQQLGEYLQHANDEELASYYDFVL